MHACVRKHAHLLTKKPIDLSASGFVPFTIHKTPAYVLFKMGNGPIDSLKLEPKC